MDPVTAIMIAEGAEGASRERQVKAWQYLIDSGLAWTLQGWFGRTAEDLINQGIVRPPKSFLEGGTA